MPRTWDNIADWAARAIWERFHARLPPVASIDWAAVAAACADRDREIRALGLYPTLTGYRFDAVAEARRRA